MQSTSAFIGELSMCIGRRQECKSWLQLSPHISTTLKHRIHQDPFSIALYSLPAKMVIRFCFNIKSKVDRNKLEINISKNGRKYLLMLNAYHDHCQRWLINCIRIDSKRRNESSFVKSKRIRYMYNTSILWTIFSIFLHTKRRLLSVFFS